MPFALAVYALLVIVASFGGVVAVAHAMGERLARRRMARGLPVSPNSYRYVLERPGRAGAASGAAGWCSAGFRSRAR